MQPLMSPDRPPHAFQLLYWARRRDVALASSLAACTPDECEPPLGRALIDALPPYARPPAYILCQWRLRWNEAARLSIAELSRPDGFIIEQSKGGPNRQLPPLPHLDLEALKGCPPNFPAVTLPYDTLRTCLARAREHLGLVATRPALDETHIFRHLYAQWRIASGADLDVIRREMGHYNLESTFAYVNSRFTHA